MYCYKQIWNKFIERNINSYSIKENFTPSNKYIQEKVEKNKKIFPEIEKKYKYKPFYLQIILSKFCNLKCSYCHVRASKDYTDKIQKEHYISMIPLLKEKWIKSLLLEFQGGEPLLQFDIIKDIVKEYWKYFNLKIIITTNWTIFNEDIVNFLLLNNVSLNISIDGNKAIHNKNRWWYDAIIKNIKKYQEYIPSINYIGTLNLEFLNYSSKEIIDSLLRNNIKNYMLRPVLNIWRQEEQKNIKLINFYKKFIEDKRIKETFSEIIIDTLKNKNTIKEFDIFWIYKTIAIDYRWFLYLNDYHRSLNENNLKININEIFDLNDFYENTFIKKELKVFFKENKNRLIPVDTIIKNTENDEKNYSDIINHIIEKKL